jgi:4-hydroxy-3-polyprenylbenzoate decarboxylase
MSRDLVLAFTGASGAIYGVRLLEVLLASGRNVHLTISPAAVIVFERELGLKVDLKAFQLEQILPEDREGSSVLSGFSPVATAAVESSSVLSETPRGHCHYHHFLDFMAGIASGSFRTAGMVVCPCSMGTVASIAHGLSESLVQRAADVHLKERRKLIVVPRETPLGSIQLENMKRLVDAGGIVLPAMPGFYHNPTKISDLIDFVVGRILDHLGIEHKLHRRWGVAETLTPEPPSD